MHETPLVLIVDDNEQVRKLFARQLALAAVRSEPASCAEDALERITRGDVSLVLIDINLGHGQSGTDLLAAVRGLDNDLPVIFITGYGSLAEDYPDVPLLPKTGNAVDTRQLVTTVKSLIRNRCRDVQLAETRELGGKTHALTCDIHKILMDETTGLKRTREIAETAAKRGLGDLIVETVTQPVVWGLLIVCGGLLSFIGTTVVKGWIH